MIQYILRRLLAMIPTLLGITFVTFCIIRLAPGDPVAAAIGKGNSEGGGATADGGGSSDKQGDAIKAKKKLLGILRDDRTVRIWDPAPVTGEAAVAAARANYRPAALAFTDRIGELPAHARTISVSADGKTLFAGAEKGVVFEIVAAEGELRRKFELGDGDVLATALSPDGSSLAVGDANGLVRVYRTSDGTAVAPAVDTQYPVRAIVALTVGGRPSFIAGCGDGVLRLFDAATGVTAGEWKNHTSWVSALRVSGDGTRLWSAGYDRRIREWDTAAGKMLRIVGEAGQVVQDLDVSPDGKLLAAACEDRATWLFDLATPTAAPRRLEGHAKGVTAVRFTADGRSLVSGGRDGRVMAFDVATGTATAQSDDSQGVVHDIVPSNSGDTLLTVSPSTAPTSLWFQYTSWLKRTATFDFDRSFVTNEPVMEKIGEAIPVTLGLNALAVLITYLIAVPWGVLAAVKRGRWFDRASSILLFMLWALPSFWVATILIMTLSSKRTFDVLPSVGLHDMQAAKLPYVAWLVDWGKHLVLPLIVMTYGSFTGLTSYMRTSMLESISQDYVRTARAKGLSERIVYFKHALRNSLITMVTLLAGLLPGMVGGSLFVEIIFTIEGMGKLSYTAVLSRDYPVIMAITTITAVLTLFGVLISDLLYGVVDPRIRHE